jgi:hypothetical protein
LPIIAATAKGKSKRANGKKRRDLRNQKAVQEALYEMSTEHCESRGAVFSVIPTLV